MATFFEQPGWRAEPGLHAFIVGISAYPNLPATADLLQPAHFEMIQLASPAITAFRLATFLVSHGERFDVPIATCRVLLTPSQAELDIEPALADFDVPDFANFSTAAKAWRADALADPAGRTLFYFAGHGLQRVKRDHVLVLHNFNDGIGGSLSSKGVNVDHLIDGMAASQAQETIARTQLYFFDTCRIQPDLFKETEIMGVGNFWDINTVPASDDRALPTFFASKPGGKAFAKPGKETLFGAALLKCLQGGAGTPANEADPDDEEWVVTIESLRLALKRFIDQANRNEEAAQESIAHLDDNFVVLRLDSRPDVSVSLKLDPAMAAGLAKVSVIDNDDTTLRDFVPFEPNPLVTNLPAGSLQIRAIVEPTQPTLRPRLRKVFVIKPPEASVEIALGK